MNGKRDNRLTPLWQSADRRIVLTQPVLVRVFMEMDSLVNDGHLKLSDPREKQLSTAAGCITRALSWSIEATINEVERPRNSALIDAARWVWSKFEVGVLERQARL